MNILSTVRDMQAAANDLRRQGLRLAFVPTMGNLHEGHLSLFRIARQHADRVIVSIFVNPTQFGPNEDFNAYPRTPDADLDLCRRENTDIVFLPPTAEMYPDGASISITESSLSRTLCGAARPGHFNGVCTIVAKLFNATLPHVAVFGEKDAQQLRVIRRLVRDLCIPVSIIPAPTSREPDGLARSSRNRFLLPHQRPQATALHRALQHARQLFTNGERDPDALETAMRRIIEREPDARIDYITIADDQTLQPLTSPITRPALAAIAAWFGSPRLIDNTQLLP